LYPGKEIKMKRVLVSAVIASVLSFFISTVFAEVRTPEAQTEEPVSFSLGANIGRLSGNTQYRITFSTPYLIDFYGTYYGYYTYYGQYGEGASELVFPLDSWIGILNASLGKKGLWSIDLSLSKNLTGDTGKMEDSDFEPVYVWSTDEFTQRKTIYSEWDTEMDAFMLDLSGRYYFLRKEHISLGAIGGYRYQNLSFEINNGYQKSLIGWYSPVYFSGKVMTYEITYSIPYGGIALDLRPSNRFSINLSAAYGWAFAEDEDDHILRSKRSTAESDGPFYSLKALGTLSLTQRLFLLLALEYLKMDTDGKQTQTWYATTSEAAAGTTLSNINYSAKSEQTYFWAGIKLRF
jgi:hypothetical protein